MPWFIEILLLAIVIAISVQLHTWIYIAGYALIRFVIWILRHGGPIDLDFFDF
jgi:hypothetical protein